MTDKNKTSRIAFGTWALVVLAAFAFYAGGCGDSDEETEGSNNTTTTEEALDLNAPDGVGFTNTGSDVIDTIDGDWEYDMAHSSVRFQALYNGKHALMTGVFAEDDIQIKFDQSDLASSKIMAAVKLSSAFTGEPGRDGLGKCLTGYLGVQQEQDADGNWTVADPDSDVASFESTSIEPYLNGYRAVGDLNFRGTVKQATLVFGYTGYHRIETHGDAINEAGFIGKLTFNAQSDYGVEATNISDKVEILIDANFAQTIAE